MFQHDIADNKQANNQPKVQKVPVSPWRLSQTVQSCGWDIQQATNRPTVSPNSCQFLLHQGVGALGQTVQSGHCYVCLHQDLSFDSAEELYLSYLDGIWAFL